MHGDGPGALPAQSGQQGEIVPRWQGLKEEDGIRALQVVR